MKVKDLAEAIDSTHKKAKNGIKVGAEAVGFDDVMSMIGKLISNRNESG